MVCPLLPARPHGWGERAVEQPFQRQRLLGRSSPEAPARSPPSPPVVPRPCVERAYPITDRSGHRRPGSCWTLTAHPPGWADDRGLAGAGANRALDPNGAGLVSSAPTRPLVALGTVVLDRAWILTGHPPGQTAPFRGTDLDLDLGLRVSARRPSCAGQRGCLVPGKSPPPGEGAAAHGGAPARAHSPRPASIPADLARKISPVLKPTRPLPRKSRAPS